MSEKADYGITHNWNLITRAVVMYFKDRGLHQGTVEQYMQFIATEYGEACEQLLARDPHWTRNNPNGKPKAYDPIQFAYELGDVIMMCILAGLAEGVDPIEAMLYKMDAWRESVINRPDTTKHEHTTDGK